ncbi:MAG TPA: hypothetical protein PLJ60_08455 [Chryseolinea sp.]|nr:hypothetical protein [Chryseolinea sp.]HPM30356.1 hypothetical protein [Chryseolinea sp.]
MRIFLTLFFFLLVSITSVCAQDVTVRGGFFLDSLQIGEPSGYYLSATYPSTENILFPDSTFNFAPFEWGRKKYFTTETTDGRSYDSVVYYLSTFELDEIQTLSLPVFQLNPKDCTTFESNRDSIRLILLATNIPDTVSMQTLPLKASVAYQNVPYDFNYLILLIVLSVLIVILALVWIFFGKKIRRHFRMKRLQKAHHQFLEIFSSNIESVQAAFSPATAESTLSFWKKYMERLEARPYTKLTTSEMIRLLKDEVLKKNLHAVDSAIYGHNTSVVESLESLKVFANERFSKKLEEIKHG